MDMENTTQTQYDRVRQRVTVRGRVNGVGFSALIDPQRRLAEWIEPTENVLLNPKMLTVGGAPSHREEDCEGCDRSVRDLLRLASGGIEAIKAKLGIGKAPAAIVAQRKATCESCPSNCYDFGECVKSRGGCGCILSLKILRRDQTCPHDHWGAVDKKGAPVGS